MSLPSAKVVCCLVSGKPVDCPQFQPPPACPFPAAHLALPAAGRCPGALADALLRLAEGMRGAGLAFVRDLRTRLLTLFSGKTRAPLHQCRQSALPVGSMMVQLAAPWLLPSPMCQASCLLLCLPVPCMQTLRSSCPTAATWLTWGHCCRRWARRGRRSRPLQLAACQVGGPAPVWNQSCAVLGAVWQPVHRAASHTSAMPGLACPALPCSPAVSLSAADLSLDALNTAQEEDLLVLKLFRCAHVSVSHLSGMGCSQADTRKRLARLMLLL